MTLQVSTMSLISYNMNKVKFYKNRYALAVYDEEDYLIFIADNVKELCEHFDLKYEVVYSTLAHNIRRLVIGHHYTKIHFIDMKEDTY